MLVVVRAEGLNMHKIYGKLGAALAAAVAVLLAVVGVTASSATAAPVAVGATSATTVGSKITAGSSKWVAVNGLRLRSTPGYGGYVKGLLYDGDRVFIRETFTSSYRLSGWVGVVLKIKSKGGLPRMTRGYVWKSYLA
ncbi:hypothetical protein [Streptomyces sp. NBC_01429]|uniref:hypothetical protein n=1 Tax=Streptomyces sp. NBC_01429 TaxID=2903862 RepID=UPI002E2AA01C|nr:hypothetical protein [Streptomyces sp. NBC_01429]